jgi:hyperosmotically inducible protein
MCLANNVQRAGAGKKMRASIVVTAVMVPFLFGACGDRSAQSPDVAGPIRQSLAQQNLKGVSVSQDRDKGVVTLSGQVATSDEKARAESVARSVAANLVLADEIAIIPPNDGGASQAMYSALDKGIESNLEAALIGGGFRTGISHTVKNGVVTLKGSVDTEDRRAQVEKIAQGVPNTQQVINEIQTTHEKATSSR